ncbi:hypothetical protein D9M68_653440 [compost metagenome]
MGGRQGPAQNPALRQPDCRHRARRPGSGVRHHPARSQHRDLQWPGDGAMRRAATSALRLLRPRAGDPAAFRAPPLRLRRLAQLRLRSLRAGGGAAGARARQRAGPDLLATAAAARRVGGQAAHWRGFHRHGQCAGHAVRALRPRRRPRPGGADRRAHARRGLHGLGGAGAGEGRVPQIRRRWLPGRGHFRQPPARGAAHGDPHARHPQQPPAVHRAHRHGQPGLCRQRVQRHRAAVFLDVPAQEARGRRHDHRLRG